MNQWLFGLHPLRVQGNIYTISITGYGPADVGPYMELKRFVNVNSGLECHHIVEVEHLRLFNTLYMDFNAPSIAIPASMHRRLISPRFTAEMNVFGGRRGGIADGIAKEELLDLYRQVYTWHTPFQELYTISKNILNQA